MGTLLPILFFIVAALVSSSSRRKAQEKQQQARRRTSATLDEMERAPRRYAPAATPQPRPARAERPAPPTPPAAPAAAPAAAAPTAQKAGSYSPITHTVQTQGSLDYASSEGEVSAYSAEGSSAYNDTEAVRPSIENGSGHVVHVSFESDHAHVESSTTGFEECPPERKQDENYALPTERASTMPTLGFSQEDIRRAIVYSEIFSKPRALRR